MISAFKLRKTMTYKHISINQLAKKSELSRSVIIAMRDGIKTNCYLSTIEAIADGLDVTVDSLLERRNNVQ